MFELIDSISIFPEQGVATGKAMVPASLTILADHFPGIPILPGTWLVELAAQVAGPLAEEIVRLRYQKERWAVVGMINNARFLRPLPLPATIFLEAQAYRCELSNICANIVATENNEVILRSKLTMMMIKTSPLWDQAIDARHRRIKKWKTFEDKEVNDGLTN